MIKNFYWWAVFGRSATMNLNKNGPPHGALTTWDGIFFIKYTPFVLKCCTGKCYKSQNWSNLGPICWNPHLSKMTHIAGPKIHELQFFFIKRTPFEFSFCASGKFFKLVHSGLIGRPQILMMAIFSWNWPPLNLDLVQNIAKII